jgi:glyoxylase-like metal-dependent hydrolase (beta-lactamase superfamily II)
MIVDPIRLRPMKAVAKDVWLLGEFPPNLINIYLVGDVLIDSGTRLARKRIDRQLRGRTLSAHALTHAHLDHMGCSAYVCSTYNVPLFCGAGDSYAMETGDFSRQTPDNAVIRAQLKLVKPTPQPVARKLTEGDEVADFKVIETPGHAPGHVVYWRESDRVLIIGDVLFNLNAATGITGLHEPIKVATPDPAENRRSARKLRDLEPSVVLFGHGPPLRDPAKYRAFIDALPA